MRVLRLKSSLSDVRTTNLWKSLVAEWLGTFILVYIGSASGSYKVNSLKVGMGFGLGGAVAIYCIGNISGGHINPAVSFGLLIARQISLVRFVLYCIVQVIGALSAAQMSKISEAYRNKTTGKITKESDKQLLICEIIITFFLVFTVMRLCVEKCRSVHERAFAPLMIGVAIMLGVFSGGEIGGGSMNPAASIGLAYGDRRLWIFVVGPLLGGTIAALLHQLVFTSNLSMAHVKDYLLGPDFDTKEDETGEEYKKCSTNKDRHCETSA